MRVRLALLADVVMAASANAQDTARTDSSRIGSGISIGDPRGVNGLRLNVRDSRLERVNGVNLTIWLPVKGRGVVNGLELGLPATGDGSINGVALAIAGVAVKQNISGIGLAGLGIGAGERLAGVNIAGL